MAFKVWSKLLYRIPLRISWVNYWWVSHLFYATPSNFKILVFLPFTRCASRLWLVNWTIKLKYSDIQKTMMNLLIGLILPDEEQIFIWGSDSGSGSLGFFMAFFAVFLLICSFGYMSIMFRQWENLTDLVFLIWPDLILTFNSSYSECAAIKRRAYSINLSLELLVKCFEWILILK